MKLKYILSILTITTLLSACGVDLNTTDVTESGFSDTNPNTEQQKVCLGTVTTSSSALNVRSTPEINDNICNKLEKGAAVTIALEEPENGFFKVVTDSCPNRIGFASIDFIRLGTTCPVAESNDSTDNNESRLPTSAAPLPTPQPAGTINNVDDYISKNLKRVASNESCNTWWK